jgi:FlaA1/EpsC-like NDP-sugar epimerase
VLRIAEKLRARLVALPRRHKRFLQLFVDVLLVWAALWLAFWVRLGDIKLIEPLAGHAWLFALAPIIAIPLFIRGGMYRAVMR